MEIIRVFARKTNASPIDKNVRFGMPGLFEVADKINISVTFTYDLKWAEQLYNQWKYIAPTEIGGPATGMSGEEFTPGMYLKKGLVITSRGCNNKCWFCSVWKREGKIKELPITNGWNVMDDNLLQCSENHIQSVFYMLKRQKQKPRFTGGLESKLITSKRAKELKELNPDYMYFAYDTPDDYEPLINAGLLLRNAGFGEVKKSHVLSAYVLIGYHKDTFDKAEKRLIQTIQAGFAPFAMLWKNDKGETDKQWRRFSREWNRPGIVHSRILKYAKI